MPTRNVVLTDHQTALVESLVKSGRYQNASEVLREGLRMVEQREAEDSLRLQALRSAAQVGAADIDSGRFTEHSSRQDIRTLISSIADKTLSAR